MGRQKTQIDDWVPTNHPIPYVTNREHEKEDFDPERIRVTVEQAGVNVTDELMQELLDECRRQYNVCYILTPEEIQDAVENVLMAHGWNDNAGRYIASRFERRKTRDLMRKCKKWMEKYLIAPNTANATIDDNSNVGDKNIAVMNSELHKPTNIEINREMVMHKIHDLYPGFNPTNYSYDLNSHIIYKHDESTFAGAIAPYCASISMYPFLQHGLRNVGGQSGQPTNLDAFCGSFINLVFIVAAQFAGAVATSEFFVCFDHFARMQFGQDYADKLDNFYTIGDKFRTILNKTCRWVRNVNELNSLTDADLNNDAELIELRKQLIEDASRQLTDTEVADWYEGFHSEGDSDFNLYKLGDGTRTIKGAIIQYFQQIVYTLNQPAASRGNQSVFINFSYFDKPFFEGMFSDMKFPLTKTQERAMERGEDVDFDVPVWNSVNALQQLFIRWFNKERLRTVLTFPVESYAIVLDPETREPLDKDTFDFITEMYAEGHSMFLYNSTTVDSLSSCCRLKNVVEEKDREFSFTNGNMGVMTGSKSVITINLNRLTQNFCKLLGYDKFEGDKFARDYTNYLGRVLDRVYRYHTAYDCCLRDMYKNNMLTIYKAGMIDLDKQYLTVGLNGLNEAAEFLGIKVSDNPEYAKFCQMIFSYIKARNTKETREVGLKFNTELVPAESLGAKNYKWDELDGYWVPKEIDPVTGLNKRNIYTSYIFIPSHKYSVKERIKMHGDNYIGEYLDGGSACHINLTEHLDKEQVAQVLRMAFQNGCQYLTFNVPYTECNDCHLIVHKSVCKCGRCGGTHLTHYDRIIGYLTAIDRWSAPRQQEGRFRDRTNNIEGDTEETSEDGSSRSSKDPP